jgi:preprotein translocase subunit SecD
MFMAELLKNWRIWLLFVVITISFGLIMVYGINLGIDLKGGTLFQIKLSEKVTNPADMERIINVTELRLNYTGMKDTRVFSVSNELVYAEVPVTDPEEIKRLESIIVKQGRFEVMIDGNVIFTGADIIEVDQRSARLPVEKISGRYRWMLPFVLKFDAAKRFRDMVFHRCRQISFSRTAGEDNYECDKTYFFIDRPADSVLIFSRNIYENDKSMFAAGVPPRIPANTDVDEVLRNAAVPYIIVDGNELSQEQYATLKSMLATKKRVILSSDLQHLSGKLSELGYRVRVEKGEESLPWLWTSTGLREIVALRPSITGNDPYVETKDRAPIITDLIIEGFADTEERAKQERAETKTILQSGSLPVSIESISRESISAPLGREFLFQLVVMGVIVLIVVSLIIFLRYRQPKISLAIIFTSLVEAFVTLTYTSILGSIDIAALAGIIAAVGTGVDDQIVITDELVRGRRKEEISLLSRIKRAFFIVIASAATMMATMLPLIIFGRAMVKLMGFGIAVLIGVLVGVLVTRPAYAEIAAYILRKK